jgi:sugar lactone lactonase YvrE
MVDVVAVAVAGLVAVNVNVPSAASAEPGSSDPPRAEVRYQTKVLVRGAPIHGANGLAVDAEGRLLVASVFGSELVVLDPATGQILNRLDIGVESPDDVAVGPDGSIYWTDLIVGEVGRLAPNGQVTKQFVAPGMNPIAFTAEGRLFVGQAFQGDGLYELDPNLVQAPRVVIPDSGAAPFARQLNGFDFGPDGMLYAPQPFLGTIVRIDPDTGAMEVVTDALAGLGPTSVEFDSQGHLYASLFAGTIIRIDTDTGAHQVVTEISDAILDNMVFDARDRLYVSNSDDGAVYAVAPGGGVRTLSPGGLILPGGIAVMEGDSGRDSLFVADVWKLAEFDARSGRLLDVDRQSRAGGGIIESFTVAPDGGNVIITSWVSRAVQIWDPVSDVAVDVFTDFAVPLNAIRFQDDLVVAELGTGSVAREDATGGRSVIATGLFVPAGLAATDDDLWVADWATGIVWKIVDDGATLTQPQLTAAGLQSPEGMAVDSDGSLLVVEAGAGRLSRIDPVTGQVTTVADGLELGLQGSAAAPPTWALSSVAVGRSGTIFVTGDLASVVYRVRRLPAA